MRDPIDRPLWEHPGIMRQVAALREALSALERRGADALPEALPALRATARMIETELLPHARREDEALFPAVERVLGAEGSPTGAMREEHPGIHAQAERFRGTVRHLAEVEHPAIVAESGRLRDLAAAGDDAAALRRSGVEIVRLLDEHFGREAEILFPMAREVLEPADLEAVARRMEALDAGR
jgi:iron-sulfur cluster repair protein YtfE (RIC family)